MLKECAESLCGPLAFIFRLSLRLGIFPETWKEALVSAIFKKIDPTLCKYYRPISLLSCISKVFEKVVFDHTYPYLIENKLLPPHNSGFKQNDSAINRIIAMLEDIYTGLDQHEDSIFVSLDISKAFDRVWHRGLTFKLKQLGITGKLLDWFTSYLSGRCQRVAIGGQKSSLRYTNAGVPQGSILGPMLFLVYIYDMCNGLKSKPHQFADDTNINYRFKNPVIAVNDINLDLDKLSKWADRWKVNFAPSKTFYMRITNRNHQQPLPTIYLCGEPITETTQIKTLGVTLTKNLSWGVHINNIISRASKRLLVMRKYRFCLSRKALETIYISMIRPILEYGNVLYDNCPASTGRSIESIQRQAALICTGGYKHTDYKNLLSELNWETLCDRRKLHKLVIFYKIKNKIYPDYLSSYLKTNQNSTYNLRHTNEQRPRFSRLNNSFKSFFPSTVRLWNNLPSTTRDSNSVNIFKALVRGTNKYNPYHRLCSNKPGIWLTRLRLGLSALNSHRFKYNFIESPKCPTCHAINETTQHY